MTASAVSASVWERLASLGATTTAPPKAATPQLLVVLAHPDDETLALGGRMERLTETRFLTVTDGVPLDGADARAHGFASLPEYGRARRAELQAAFELAGLDSISATRLQLQSGLEVSDQQAAFSLTDITRAVAREIRACSPEAVLTHPYEGGHPDHDACAFAVRAAVRLSGFPGPVVEAPFYHAGPQGIVTGKFLSGDAGSVARLTPDQIRNKMARLACFRSQAETLGLFPVDVERFREAPSYDFTRRPMEGQLYYERFPWGMDGDRFCALATDAQRELGL